MDPELLGGTLEQGPAGEIWVRRYAGPAGSKIRPVIVEKLSAYSFEDQKILKQLYQRRSEMARDPDLSPADRQAALDIQDAKISAIPKQPPILREPEPKDKFEAMIFPGPNGQPYYFKANGDPAPLEVVDTQKEAESNYQQLLQTNIGKALDAREKLLSDPETAAQAGSEQQAIIAATFKTNAQTGRLQDAPGVPEQAVGLFQEIMTAVINANRGFWGAPGTRRPARKLTEKEWDATYDKYVKAAVEVKGISPAQAHAAFMSEWVNVFDEGMYKNVIPKPSDETRREALYAQDATLFQSDPEGGAVAASIAESTALADAKVQGGTVTLQAILAEVKSPGGAEVPQDDRQVIERMIAAGMTKSQIVQEMKDAGYE
jgi:hypothetical protein